MIQPTGAIPSFPPCQVNRPSYDGLAENEANCTFAPSINPASERLLEDSTNLPADFQARQRFFAQQRKAHLHRIAAQSVEARECTFSPDREAMDVGGAAAGLGESRLERWERLAYQDWQRVQAARAASASQHYSQFTFQPHIDPHSRRIGQATTLKELVQNSRARSQKAEAAAEIEAQRQQECTFAPDVRKAGSGRKRRNSMPATSASPNRVSHRSQDSKAMLHKIEAWRKEKQDRLEEARNLREYEELLDCTFTPSIAPAAPPPKGPIVIPGLDRHLELQDLAKRQAQDLQQRQAKAFKLNPQPGPFLATVPAPFRFKADDASGKTEARRAKLRETLMAAAMKECTFRPRTNESANKALISQILAAADLASPCSGTASEAGRTAVAC
ncbi:hypothetical protein WJX84_008453 [Apatococcus fuscideae]|uniref:Uncharacterized protein n=1 Tax=Apatococcus fuscideae TaxID=2026836 RepID=A0AAW1SNH6_9CHLO